MRIATIRFIPVAVLAASSLSCLCRAQDGNLPSAPDPQQSASQQRQQQQPQQPSQPQQPAAPNLGDLGFPNQQTQANPRLQALLDRRTHMLKVHQNLGLITLAPMAATLITGPMAKAKGRNGETIKEPTDANLDFHMELGGLTTAMYWTTASYAIFAPNVAGIGALEANPANTLGCPIHFAVSSRNGWETTMARTTKQAHNKMKVLRERSTP
jgi:hypothetical protein